VIPIASIANILLFHFAFAAFLSTHMSVTFNASDFVDLDLSSLGSWMGGSSSSAITLVTVVVTHVGFDIGFPSDPTVVSLRVVLHAKVTV
jgi:hypothetical protein